MKFGEWKPDGGPYFQDDGQGINLIRAENVLPKINGYTIVPELYSPPTTPELATGLTIMADSKANLWSYMDSANGPSWYYGTTTGSTLNSKRYDESTNNFTAPVDRRRAGGYSASAPGGWRFCRYGNKTLATNGTDAIQKRTLGGGAFAKNNVITSPVTGDPRARYIETFQGHLILGYFDLTAGTSGAETYGGAYASLTAQVYSQSIWWSGTDDETRFADPLITPQILGSDFKHFTDELGDITGMKACYDYVAIFRERGIVIMTGPPFRFSVLSETVGTIFYNSIVRNGSDIYFLSEYGPYVIRGGTELVPLGEGKINDWISYIKMPLWNSSDYSFYFHGATTHSGEYVAWTYPRLSGHLKTDGSPGGDYSELNFNTLLVYSVANDQFSYANIHDPYNPTVNVLTPIASYHKHISRWGFNSCDQNEDEFAWNNLSGISVVCKGDALFHPDVAIGKYDDNIALFNQFRNQLEGGDNPSILQTAYMPAPKNDLGLSSFRIVKVRPIYWMEKGIAPTEDINTIDRVDDIFIHPRNAYFAKDRTYDPTGGGDGFEADTSTYQSSTSHDTINGWYHFKNSPFAHLYSIEFRFESTSANRLIYGFEVEIEFGGDPGNKKSLELRG